MSARRGVPQKTVVAACLVGLVLFAAIAVELVRSGAVSLDGPLERLVRRALGAPLHHEDEAISAVSYVATAVSGCAAVTLFLAGRRRQGLLWLLGVGGALALDPILKAIFKRPELSGRGAYSFPSGSAMLSMAIVVALVITVPRMGRLVAGTLGALAVVVDGALVVQVRWHYPSDVLAGWCIALAWVTALWLVLARAEPLALHARRRGRVSSRS